MTCKVKQILFLFLLSIVVVGCRPSGVLSPDEMRDILYELHRADGAYKRQVITIHTTKRLRGITRIFWISMVLPRLNLIRPWFGIPIIRRYLIRSILK